MAPKKSVDDIWKELNKLPTRKQTAGKLLDLQQQLGSGQQKSKPAAFALGIENAMPNLPAAIPDTTAALAVAAVDDKLQVPTIHPADWTQCRTAWQPNCSSNVSA